MTVSELIKILEIMPPDLDVYVYASFDGMCGSGPLVGAGVISGDMGDAAHLGLVDEPMLDLLDAEPANGLDS